MKNSSYLIGVRWFSTEWRCWRLWKVSIQSKIGLANSTWVFYFWQSSSSICIEDRSSPSWGWLIRHRSTPNDVTSPADRTFSPKTHEVNWVP